MATPTIHNSAQYGDIAKTVLMPGDPMRAKFIAEQYLENPVLVNNVRGVQGYTGTWKNVPVTLCLFLLLEVCTQVIQRADGTLWAACRADVPTKMDETMAQAGLLRRLDYFLQSHLHLIGIFAAILGGQTQLIADADTVGICHDGRLSVNIRQDQIGRFSADAGKRFKFFN